MMHLSNHVAVINMADEINREMSTRAYLTSRIDKNVF